MLLIALVWAGGPLPAHVFPTMRFSSIPFTTCDRARFNSERIGQPFKLNTSWSKWDLRQELNQVLIRRRGGKLG